jgi:hypothetical protein
LKVRSGPPPAPKRSSGTPQPLFVRVAIAVVAISVGIAGHIDQITGGVIERQFGTKFYLWLMVDLLAPLILVLGIRRLKTTLACGAVLILLNTIPWIFWLLGSVGALSYVIFGHLFVISTCLAGAVIDQVHARKVRQTS